MNGIELGERMKKEFESKTRIFLPKKTYSIIRVDGKNFSSYTRDLVKPFDLGFLINMKNTALALCKEIQGSVIAYVQSDEISILTCDFANKKSQVWFGGNIQKIASVAASIASAEFNKSRINRMWREPNVDLGLESLLNFASFDARVFSLPLDTDVIDYFHWRKSDCIKNSISMAASNFFSHKDLEGKSNNEKKSMLISAGCCWDNHLVAARYGTVFVKRDRFRDVSFTKSNGKITIVKNAKRSVWLPKSAEHFSFASAIPKRGEV